MSIYIGLGGHGVDAIRRLKTKVYSEIRPDSEEGKSYEHIMFLGIDSNWWSFGNRDEEEYIDRRLKLETDERLHILVQHCVNNSELNF